MLYNILFFKNFLEKLFGFFKYFSYIALKTCQPTKIVASGLVG